MVRLIWFWILISRIVVVAVDYNDDHPWQPADKTGWIDPSDPSGKFQNANVETATVAIFAENQRLKARIAELEGSRGALVPSTPERSTCDQSSTIDELEFTIFKHFLRKVESKFPTTGSYEAEIRISSQILSLWKEFLATSSSTPADSKTLRNIADSVADLFGRVRKASEDSKGFFDPLWDFIRSYLPLLNFCILVPAAGLLLVRILRVSRWQLALWILFLLFFISVVWTWIHLYKERQAEMQARFVRHGGGTAELCKPKGGRSVSAWEALQDYVGSWFWFKDDPCVEYFKDVMIDPVWTVSPLEAVSVAVTKFFVRPLEPLAEGISRFWRALLKDLPITAYFIVFPAMGASIVFLVLVLFGYRLRLGFGLFSLEPYAVRRASIQQAALTSRRENREISTQTLPAVTWSRVDPRDAASGDQPHVDHARAHVRRGSVSS